MESGWKDRPTVLAVSRWADVFETAESRRHKSLIWISVPVSFNSTGLQRLLDEFDGVTAAALYGCWNALLKVAATAPTRGVLAGQKGEPYTAGRLARLSGFPPELFEKLVAWCLRVGWLVDAQAIPGLPDQTRQDITKPDRTGPDQTKSDPGPARPEMGLFLKSMETRAAGKPDVIELMQKPVEPLRDALTPGALMQCWNGCGWSDAFAFSPGSDGMERSAVRRSLLNWFRRQLAAPDPVVNDPTFAGAIGVLAIAETAATRPGLKNRPAWFRAQLRPQRIPDAVRDLNSKAISAAAKFVAGELSK